MSACKNYPCERPIQIQGGPRCRSCATYFSTYGRERPERLVFWPSSGHPLLRTKDLAKLLDMSYRQIDYAIRTEKIVPTVSADGSGTTIGFDLDDAVEAMVALTVPEISDLAKIWINVEVDRQAARLYLSRNWPADREPWLPRGWPDRMVET